MWKSPSLRLSGPLSISILLDRNSGKGGDDGRLSLEEWQNLFRELKDFVTDIHVHCEKPEEDFSYFLSVIRLIESREIRFHVHCSGLWKEPQNFLNTMRGFSHFLYLYLPVFGATAASHLKICGEDRFEELCENVRLCSLYACDVILTVGLNRINIHEIEDVIQHYQNLGARKIEFERRVMGPDPEMDLSDKEIEDALLRIEQMIQEGWRASVGGCFPRCFSKTGGGTCRGGGVNYCAVDSSGFVRPCLESGLKVGRVDRGGLLKVWKSRAMQKWGENNPPECRNCDAFRTYRCFGGCKCYAEKLGVSGDPLVRKAMKTDDFEASSAINLDGALCPLPRYKIRQEPFGFILIHDGEYIPVRKGASDLLSAVDGETSLKNLESRFGSEVIPLLFNLYMRKFLVFRTNRFERPQLSPPTASGPPGRVPQEQRKPPRR